MVIWVPRPLIIVVSSLANLGVWLARLCSITLPSLDLVPDPQTAKGVFILFLPTTFTYFKVWE